MAALATTRAPIKDAATRRTPRKAAPAPRPTDVVDVCTVEGAPRRHDLVVSSDPDHLQAIAVVVNRRLEIDRP
jgi:hypothetical protein